MFHFGRSDISIFKIGKNKFNAVSIGKIFFHLNFNCILTLTSSPLACDL